MFNPDPMLVTLLQATVAAGASDLHLTVGRPPTVRRDGVLVPFEGVSVLQAHDTDRMVMSLLSDDLRAELEEASQVQTEIETASNRIAKIVSDLRAFARPAPQSCRPRP